jgi:hypothetical protein
LIDPGAINRLPAEAGAGLYTGGLVQRRAVHLPPALTLSAQVVLGFLAGFIGLIFATPLVAAGLVLVRMTYVEDILGNRESEPAPSIPSSRIDLVQ